MVIVFNDASDTVQYCNAMSYTYHMIAIYDCRLPIFEASLFTYMIFTMQAAQ